MYKLTYITVYTNITKLQAFPSLEISPIINNVTVLE